jgi:hypothetical protein
MLELYSFFREEGTCKERRKYNYTHYLDASHTTTPYMICVLEDMDFSCKFVPSQLGYDNILCRCAI